jgi:hypothetical protein
MLGEGLTDDCTPEEAVGRIRRTPANPMQIRPSATDLADVLRAAPSDPTFNLESWQREWSEVEADSKSLTHVNEIAEGRGC